MLANTTNTVENTAPAEAHRQLTDVFGGAIQYSAAIAAGGSDNSNGQGDGKPNVPVQITNVTVATS